MLFLAAAIARRDISGQSNFENCRARAPSFCSNELSEARECNLAFNYERQLVFAGLRDTACIGARGRVRRGGGISNERRGTSILAARAAHPGAVTVGVSRAPPDLHSNNIEALAALAEPARRTDLYRSIPGRSREFST